MHNSFISPAASISCHKSNTQLVEGGKGASGLVENNERYLWEANWEASELWGRLERVRLRRSGVRWPTRTAFLRAAAPATSRDFALPAIPCPSIASELDRAPAAAPACLKRSD